MILLRNEVGQPAYIRRKRIITGTESPKLRVLLLVVPGLQPSLRLRVNNLVDDFACAPREHDMDKLDFPFRVKTLGVLTVAQSDNDFL